jgi:bacterioferritin
MKHADRIVGRILLLDGLPNLQDLDKLFVGEDVKEVLECDLRQEQKALPELRAAIDRAETARDYVTRDLLSEILEDEEEHIDFIEIQLDQIGRMGLENYIQLQSSSAA